MDTAELPTAFWAGVAQFNTGQFYECHDTLEAIWMEAPEPPRSLYQGILQIAVACYHLNNHNIRGAMILLGEGISRIQKYEPDFAEIDIDRLVTDSADLLHTLQHTEPAAVTQVTQRPQIFQLTDKIGC